MSAENTRSWFSRRVWSPLKATFENWNQHDGGLLSAAMAFYASFSLFPLLLVLIAGLGLAARFSAHGQNARQELLTVVDRNAGPWVAIQLKNILDGVEDKAGVGGPLGLAALIFAALGIFAQFENLFQRIWALPGPQSQGVLATLRSVLRERLVAFVMLLVVGALVIAIFIANLLLSGLQPHIVQWAGGAVAWRWGQVLISMSFNMLLFALIYKVLPKARVRWTEALAGGALVALVWEIGQRVLVRLVIGEKYSAYGVIGSFMAIMLWMYYASAMLFLGAEFVRAICRDCNAPPPSHS